MERESLIHCCASVDAQKFQDLEHIVMADVESPNHEMMYPLQSPKRMLKYCGARHNNYGNTCRRNAWLFATGEWIWHLDDDNFIAETTTLTDMAAELSQLPQEVKFAIFPIWRYGSWFFRVPPGLCQTDTMNVVVRREVGRWPDGPEYTMDGIWVEALKAKYPYAAFPNFAPIGVMPKSSLGQ